MTVEEMAERIFIETLVIHPRLTTQVVCGEDCESRSIEAQDHAKVCFLLAASFEVVAAEAEGLIRQVLLEEEVAAGERGH